MVWVVVVVVVVVGGVAAALVVGDVGEVGVARAVDGVAEMDGWSCGGVG